MFMFSSSDQMILQCPARPIPMERRWKSNVELAPNCPRCASPNTKFCYYNNYSLSQPRYFCKACRRYWTKGGSLRNVPVGGGCRKNRRAKSSIRLSQNDHPSIAPNYTKNLLLGNNCSSNLESMANQNGSDGSSDIDLVAVFAKFLSQDSSRTVEPELSDQQLPNEANELISVSNVLQESNDLEDLPQMLVEEKPKEEGIQELIESNDVNELGVQSFLNEELVMWSDAANIPPNVTWQPMVQLQEFDSFSVDDQLKISADFLGDGNWGSFDLSGLEVFSRP